MTFIEDSNITITKGDTLLLQIEVKRDGEDYICNEGDSIRFALKNKYSDAECLIIKNVPTDTLLLNVPAADMKRLEVGKYVYDIQLTSVDGIVDTFISGKLTVTNEVE